MIRSLEALEAFSLGRPYDGTQYLQTLRNLCDTVIKTHFRRYDPDDEVFSVAIFKVTKLLKEGKIDFSRTRSKVFSFVYTVVRNEIGNYLKSRFAYYTKLKTAKERAAAREHDRQIRSHGAPPWALESPDGYEDTATINATASRVVEGVASRLREIGFPDTAVMENYAGLCLRTACFRAAFGTG